MIKLVLVAALMTLVNCNPGMFEKLFGAQKSDESQNGGARIVGGQTANERYNYQISMQMRSKDGGGSGGGGFPFFYQQPASNWS